MLWDQELSSRNWALVLAVQLHEMVGLEQKCKHTLLFLALVDWSLFSCDISVILVIGISNVGFACPRQRSVVICSSKGFMEVLECPRDTEEQSCFFHFEVPLQGAKAPRPQHKPLSYLWCSFLGTRSLLPTWSWMSLHRSASAGRSFIKVHDLTSKQLLTCRTFLTHSNQAQYSYHLWAEVVKKQQQDRCSCSRIQGSHNISGTSRLWISCFFHVCLIHCVPFAFSFELLCITAYLPLSMSMWIKEKWVLLLSISINFFKKHVFSEYSSLTW